MESEPCTELYDKHLHVRRSVCAGIASGMAVTDPRAARQLGHASLGVSVGGIIVSIFITVVVFGVVISDPGH